MVVLGDPPVAKEVALVQEWGVLRNVGNVCWGVCCRLGPDCWGTSAFLTWQKVWMGCTESERAAGEEGRLLRRLMLNKLIIVLRMPVFKA